MNGDDRQNNTNSPRSASSSRKVVSSEKCPGRQMAVVYLVPAGGGAVGGWRQVMRTLDILCVCQDVMISSGELICPSWFC